MCSKVKSVTWKRFVTMIEQEHDQKTEGEPNLEDVLYVTSEVEI